MYSLLALINLLTPKARGSRRVARGVNYGASDRQRLDIYAPAGGERPWPVVYFIYGGSWRMGERSYYEFAGRALAAAGFVVVIVDYRALPEVEYPVFLEDCSKGLAWVAAHIAEYGGDPSRLALVGHSAGAYNAVMLALDKRYARACGVRVSAVVGLSGPYDFFPFAMHITLRTFGAAADPRATQPVSLVTPDAPPMFLGHGGKDTLVYTRNLVALAAALRAKGDSVEDHIYPRLGHAGTLLALGGPAQGRAPVLTDVVTFLRAKLVS